MKQLPLHLQHCRHMWFIVCVDRAIQAFHSLFERRRRLNRLKSEVLVGIFDRVLLVAERSLFVQVKLLLGEARLDRLSPIQRLLIAIRLMMAALSC